MRKVASIYVKDGLHKFMVSQVGIKTKHMTDAQRSFINEFDVSNWRVRRHPKNGHVVELYIDPAVMDSRQKFMCEILFQS